MTLQQFFNLVSENPAIILFYYVALPLTAFLVGLFAGRDGYKSPWKYVYSALLYLAAIPGVFVIMLNVYLFLFERQSILDANIYTQFLPVIGMFVVIMLISRKVELRYIPGFGRLSGLIVLISIVLLLMWILDRTRVFAFTSFPFHFVLLGMVLFFILFRVAVKSIMK